jgi:excisionase family DNA binding protein
MNLVPLPEAARQLGLAASTLRVQIRLGRLRAIKTESGDWLIATEEVERYRRESLKRAT